MKVVIINKSDSTGGAAVVSFRLMEALRAEGIDAQMLVAEKLTDSPYVTLAARPSVIKKAFLLERLKIFASNGFNRSTLFKIDTGTEGLPLWDHPLVKDADAVLLNWVNQGMLSLEGVKKILKLGKPLIWTMHDMWCMTGICHHAGKCEHFRKECGECPLLGAKKTSTDLSHKIWTKKNHLYLNRTSNENLVFVAVSSWLREKAFESSLLKNQRVEVIPNPFLIDSNSAPIKEGSEMMILPDKCRLLFGAARLDDPIKGLDTFKNASWILNEEYPEIAEKLDIAFFGNVKNPEALQNFGIPVKHLGILRGEEVRKAYETSQIVVSASSYETLPGTLVEGQAYGCIPVSFNQGGQRDIVEDGVSGFITLYDENPSLRAKNLAEGIVKAYNVWTNPGKSKEFRKRMRENVIRKFSYPQIARRYITLINEMKG